MDETKLSAAQEWMMDYADECRGRRAVRTMANDLQALALVLTDEQIEDALCDRMPTSLWRQIRSEVD